MAALGFSCNLLTLLAMVLAIGLGPSTMAIVVLENVYRHIEEGRQPPAQARPDRCSRDRRARVILDDPDLAAVYAPMQVFLGGGVTGALVPPNSLYTGRRGNSFPGVVAVTLSPMMCSLLLSREMLRWVGLFI